MTHFGQADFLKNILSENKIDFYKATYSLNTNINGISPHVGGVPGEKYSSVFHLPYVHYDGTNVLLKKTKKNPNKQEMEFFK